jgi:hypothetical protein
MFCNHTPPFEYLKRKPFGPSLEVCGGDLINDGDCVAKVKQTAVSKHGVRLLDFT